MNERLYKPHTTLRTPDAVVELRGPVRVGMTDQEKADRNVAWTLGVGFTVFMVIAAICCRC